MSLRIGLIYALISSFVFSLMGVFTKSVSSSIPFFEIVFFRSFVTTIIISLYMFKRSYKFRSKDYKLLFLRGVLGTIGLFGYFYTVANIKLGNASILMQLSPIFVVLFASVILKEKFPKIFLFFLLLALFGSFLIIKPNVLNTATFPSFIGFLAAIVASLAYICVRKLSQRNNIFIIVFYFAIISSIACVPFMGKFVLPSSVEFLKLILVGVFSSFAQIFLTKAYRLEKAGFVSSINYSTVLFHVMWGYILWQEKLDLYSIIGGSFILLSSVFISFYKDKKIKLK
jgi:drug/metabolite transporter (DMT)-like permease